MNSQSLMKGITLSAAIAIVVYCIFSWSELLLHSWLLELFHDGTVSSLDFSIKLNRIIAITVGTLCHVPLFLFFTVLYRRQK